MSNETMGKEQREEPCPACEFGSLKPRTATYARWVAGQFITVPDFPVWTCDACRYTEYDDGALEQLESILGPGVELQRERRQAARKAQDASASGLRPGQRRVS